MQLLSMAIAFKPLATMSFVLNAPFVIRNIDHVQGLNQFFLHYISSYILSFHIHSDSRDSGDEKENTYPQVCAKESLCYRLSYR